MIKFKEQYKIKKNIDKIKYFRLKRILKINNNNNNKIWNIDK